MSSIRPSDPSQPVYQSQQPSQPTLDDLVEKLSRDLHLALSQHPVDKAGVDKALGEIKVITDAFKAAGRPTDLVDIFANQLKANPDSSNAGKLASDLINNLESTVGSYSGWTAEIIKNNPQLAQLIANVNSPND